MRVVRPPETQIDGLGGMAQEGLGRVSGHERIEFGIAQAAHGRTVAFDKQPCPRVERAWPGFEHGSEDDRVATFSRSQKALCQFEHMEEV